MNSSSICDGASTKSDSRFSGFAPAHCCRPERIQCTRWPNSWKNVDDVVVFHEARIGRRRLREVADERRLRELFAGARRRSPAPCSRASTCPCAGACRGRTARSAGPPPTPGTSRPPGPSRARSPPASNVTWKSFDAVSRMPWRTSGYGKVRPHGLRVEVVAGAAKLLGQVAVLEVVDLRRVRIVLALFGEEHPVLALHDRPRAPFRRRG